MDVMTRVQVTVTLRKLSSSGEVESIRTVVEEAEVPIVSLPQAMQQQLMEADNGRDD